MPSATSPVPDAASRTLPGPPWLIGVLHLPPLPGSPGSSRSVRAIADEAVEDARLLEQAGFTGVLAENFHDVPYRKDRVEAETIAALTVVGCALAAGCRLPFGFNVLRNDALAALAVAHATGGRFVRVNVLAGATATDQGLIEGRADELLRRRRELGAQGIRIFADVDVKHGDSLDRRPAPLRARDLARRAGADAVLVTGPATGMPPDPEELSAVADAVAPVPVLAASGTTPENLHALLGRCSGAIVGTALKDPATGRLDRARCMAYTGRKTA